MARHALQFDAEAFQSLLARACGATRQEALTLIHEDRSPKLRPYFALGVAVLVLGFSGIFVRWANAPGPVTSFYRMAIATMLVTPAFLRKLRSIRPLPARGVFFAVLGGVFFAADLGAWASGVMLSGATNPTLLANTAPLWVGLGSLLLFREKLNRRFWLGLLLAMGGAALVLGMDALRETTIGLGTLLGLLAGFFYGGYILITQRGRETLDSLTYFWISAASSSVCLLLLTVALRQPLSGYSSTTYWNFLAMGLITQMIGYLAINFALGHLPSTQVSPTLLGQPVVTSLLALPLLGEALRTWQIMGGAAVLLGVYLVHRSRNKPI
jgi:drug/metabolite transporter (DMT)-like permease